MWLDVVPRPCRATDRKTLPPPLELAGCSLMYCVDVQPELAPLVDLVPADCLVSSRDVVPGVRCGNSGHQQPVTGCCCPTRVRVVLLDMSLAASSARARHDTMQGLCALTLQAHRSRVRPVQRGYQAHAVMPGKAAACATARPSADSTAADSGTACTQLAGGCSNYTGAPTTRVRRHAML
jgi:hypothetical protein